MKDELTSDAAEPASPPIRVLIVDNDEALARGMEEALAKEAIPLDYRSQVRDYFQALEDR